MHRVPHGSALPLYLLLAALLLAVAPAAARPAKQAPARGIAILASSIGSDYSPERLAEFVRLGRFSPVIVDWAWITYHWDRTDLAAVRKLAGLLAARKVPVLAMYRPRFLSQPTAATQMDSQGKRGVDHAEICYSDAAARRWGISWGERILKECPGFREVVVYNPTDTCECPACASARAKGPYIPLVRFLAEARSAWRRIRPEAKLGVVHMPEPGFWRAAGKAIDSAHPFVRVREEIDPDREIAAARAVRVPVGSRMGPCLAKVTWEEGARVSLGKLKRVDTLARQSGLAYAFWTFDTLFASSLYDARAVARALGISPGAVGMLASSRPAPGPPTGAAQGQTAEALLKRLQDAPAGQQKFEAIDSVATAIASSSAEQRRALLSAFRAAVGNKALGVFARWPCCYVLARCADEQGVAALIEVLLQDEAETMRGVAAEALGGLADNKAARDALLRSARTEASASVRETLARYLGDSMPGSEPPPPPEPARQVSELAPSGPPTPPAGPARPVDKPLPWPFPGDARAQSIWNNYQTAVDIYVHCGLDFLHPAGTPVTAVASGYVAAISTNYPEWKTHTMFVVTPEKGGDRGWCYTHLDPDTYTFKQGDYVKQGQRLGSLVKFSVGGNPGVDHLHLDYVRFRKDTEGKTQVHSLLDPLTFFDWKDTVPPSFQALRFVSDGTLRHFRSDSAGAVTVSGKVDILAAISDRAYPGQEAMYGVPVVMLSISDGTHTVQKLVLDHRGDVGDQTRTRPLYLSRAESDALTHPGAVLPYYQVLRVTKTDGDGKIGPEDERECWDTTARDAGGKRVWPNGTYAVIVYAWDLAGNPASSGATVRVENR